jgi:hypothetical protein
MEGHSDVHIAAPYEITKTKSVYEKAKQVPGDDEAANLASSLPVRHASLHRHSQDESDEEEQVAVLQKAPVGSILHSRTY